MHGNAMRPVARLSYDDAKGGARVCDTMCEIVLQPVPQTMENKMKTFVIFTVILLAHSLLCPITSLANPPELSKDALKVRTQILKLGIGEVARLEVKLKDKTKLKGYISKTEEDHFVLVEAGSNQEVIVPYHQVQQGKGRNLSTAAKIIIAGSLVVLTFLILLTISLD
jgi:hypothetical protein